MRYRLKTVEVDAYRLILDPVNNRTPEWLNELFRDKQAWRSDGRFNALHVHNKRDGSIVTARPGDYLIRDKDGYVSVLTHVELETRYELVGQDRGPSKSYYAMIEKLIAGGLNNELLELGALADQELRNWYESALHLLEKTLPIETTVRVHEGSGPEDPLQSLIVSVMKLTDEYKKLKKGIRL